MRDARQGLSAKAEGRHGAQVTELPELRRGEALTHDREVLPVTPTTTSTTRPTVFTRLRTQAGGNAYRTRLKPTPK